MTVRMTIIMVALMSGTEDDNVIWMIWAMRNGFEMPSIAQNELLILDYCLF